MKKLFSILCLLIVAGLSAQSYTQPTLPIYTVNNLKITNPVEGKISDDFLVRGTDGIIRTAKNGGGFSEFSPAKLLIADGDYNAFPGITVAANGDWIIVYRKGTTHGIEGYGKIVLIRSSDKGSTWSSENILFTNAVVDYRDPSITKLSNGNLIMSFFTHTGGVTPPDSYDNFLSYTTKSTDNGTTWSTPALILTGVTYAGVSAPVIELSNGNLLVPTYSHNGVNHSCFVHQSTNGGTSWSIKGTIISETFTGVPNPYSTEPVIALLPNGNIIATIRNETTHKTTVSISTNSGTTWGTPVDKFDSSSRANINVGYNNRLFFTYRNWPTYEDGNIVDEARYSDDFGQTFSVVPYTAINDESAVDEYSALTSIGAGMFAKVSSIQDANDVDKADLFLKFVSSNFEVGAIKSLNTEHHKNVGRFLQIGDSQFYGDVKLKNGEGDFKVGNNAVLWGVNNDEFRSRYVPGKWQLERIANELNVFDSGHLEVNGNGTDKGFTTYIGGTFKAEGASIFADLVKILNNKSLGFGGAGGDEFGMAYLIDHFSIFRTGDELNVFNGGNVVIGSATNGPEKLQVNGKIKAIDLKLTGLPTYADDSAAGIGGLVSGDVYKTATGELRIKL